MQRFKAFLDEIAGRYLGKGAMNRAIGYARNNWHKFSAFLTHPDLPINNNPMEQAIRPFTLGRNYVQTLFMLSCSIRVYTRPAYAGLS